MIREKRILFVIPTIGFGGAEIHSLTLAKWLAGQGNEVSICFQISEGSAPLLHACKAAGIETIDAPVAPPSLATPAEVRAQQAWRLISRDLFRDFDFVIAAAPSPLSAVGVVEAMAHSGLPGIVIFHLVAQGLHLTEDTRIALLSSIRPWLKFVCVSDFTRDMLAEALGLQQEDGALDVVVNGAPNPPMPRPVDLHALVGRRQARIIATLGRLHPQKGCSTFIDAIPKVLQAEPDVRFIWFGDGPMRNEMLARAAGLGVGHALHLPGVTDRPSDVMRAADLIVLPTLYEGLSLTLLEAMQTGAAIVTTDASYQDRIFVSRQDAGIARAGSSDSLAEEIIFALRDEYLLAQYRKASISISPRFSQDRMLNGYSHIIDSVLQAHSSAKAEPPPPSCSWLLSLDTLRNRLQLIASENSKSAHVQTEHAGWDLSALMQGETDPHFMLVSGKQVQLAIKDGHRWEPISPATPLADPLLTLLQIARQTFRVEPTYTVSIFETIGSLFLKILDSLNESRALEIINGLHDFADDIGEGADWLDEALFAQKDIMQSGRLAARHAAAVRLGRRAAVRNRSMDPEATALAGAIGAPMAPFHLSARERAAAKAEFYRHLGSTLSAMRFSALERGLAQAPSFNTDRRPRAIVFAAHFNFPPRNGGDRRIASILNGYQKLGYEVTFCGVASPKARTDKVIQASYLKERFGVLSHYITLSDSTTSKHTQAYSKISVGNESFDDFYDLSLFAEFRSLCTAIAPDILHINYCYFGWLSAAVEGMITHRVLDTHDLISRRLALIREAVRLMGGKPPVRAADVPLTAFAAQHYVGLRYNLSPLELDILNQFDTILMISPSECSAASSALSVDKARTVPMHLPYLPTPESPFRKQAIYTGGANLFNIMGAAGIQNFISPMMAECTEGATVRVVGDVCRTMDPMPGLELMGRADAIEPIYASADFALCPIPCGTGQNVKIVEALSRGLPVVAFQGVGDTAGVRHGVNGLLAMDIFEMREMVNQLMRDADMFGALRASTRRWARAEFDGEQFLARFRSALYTTGISIVHSTDSKV